MNRLWQLLRVDRVTIQIALVVFVAGIASSAAIALFLFVFLPERSAPPEINQVTTEITTIVRILDAIPREQRISVADLYRRRRVTIVLDPNPADFPSTAQQPPSALPLTRDLPQGVAAVPTLPQAGYEAAFLVRLRDRQTILLQAALGPPDMLLPPFGLSLIVLCALTIALSIWAVLRIVTPLARFANGVEQFGLRGEGGPLREEGTAEVRKATSAFNRMRERIQRLIEDRTRMMIAISHDLRTPLTRLRLRAEEIPEQTLRQGMLRDMDLMENSIASAVSYLREGSTEELPEMTDLPSLVETICDQFTDAGSIVSYDGPRHLSVRLRPQAVSRAVTNLIENGTKYGSKVSVRLSLSDWQFADIDVEDDGPGIPDAEKDAVLQPFYRSSAARESVTGFGLGLAIAAEVARQHGGTLTLFDREPRGLRVRLRLSLI